MGTEILFQVTSVRHLAPVLLLLAGCVELPEEYRIEDLRIIEVRAEPPEIRLFEDAPLRATPEEILMSPIDTTPVRLRVVAAHPDPDATFEYSWIRCRAEPREPGQMTGGFLRVPCEAEQKERLGAGSSTLAFSPVEAIVEDLIRMQSDPVGAIGSLAEDPRDLFSGLFINVNAHVKEVRASIDVDTKEIDGRKRIVLFDPAVVSLVLREARDRMVQLPMIQGVELPSLCTGLSDSQLATILKFLEDRVPNRTPDYLELEYLEPGETSTKSWDPRQSPPVIEITPGESIRLAGRARVGDIEPYRVIDDNCELLELHETLAWSWFVTHGTLSTHITSQSGSDADRGARRTIYTAPDEIDGSELRVQIHSVLRDGRGGSDSLSFEVLVRP